MKEIIKLAAASLIGMAGVTAGVKSIYRNIDSVTKNN